MHLGTEEFWNSSVKGVTVLCDVYCINWFIVELGQIALAVYKPCCLSELWAADRATKERE